jgi:hypothetical protein
MQADQLQQQLGEQYASAFAAVPSVIAQCSDDCDLLLWAFKALHTQAKDNPELLVSASAADTIMAAAEEHSSSAELALWSLSALSQLAAHPKHKRSFSLGRVSALVVSIMVLHCEEQDVALWGVCAVHTLAHSDEGSRSKLAAAGACEATIAAICKHSTRADVADRGCTAVYTLARGSEADTTKLGTAGACKVVVAALAVHGSVAGVAEWGLQAISVLAVDSVNKSRLRIGAAAETVRSVAALHERNSDVQDLATAALAQLQSDSTAPATASQGNATVHYKYTVQL